MGRAGIIMLLLSQTLGASDARFTDELWVPVESLYQMVASHANPGNGQRELLNRAVHEALETLALKAPDRDWQAFLAEDALQIADHRKSTVRTTRATGSYAGFLSVSSAKKPFAEGLVIVLAEYWMNFEMRKDRGESESHEFIETLAQLTRMVNSVAGRVDDAGRRRMKEAFAQAARKKLAFEEQ